MIKSILCTTLVLFLASQVGRTQVVVNPDGSHSVVSGNIIVNPNGTHSVVLGNIIVNPNGTHSVISGNVLVNPDGTHSIFHGVEKTADAAKSKSAIRFGNREPGNFEKWISQLLSKSRRDKDVRLDNLKLD